MFPEAKALDGSGLPDARRGWGTPRQRYSSTRGAGGPRVEERCRNRPTSSRRRAPRVEAVGQHDGRGHAARQHPPEGREAPELVAVEPERNGEHGDEPRDVVEKQIPVLQLLEAVRVEHLAVLLDVHAHAVEDGARRGHGQRSVDDLAGGLGALQRGLEAAVAVVVVVLPLALGLLLRRRRREHVDQFVQEAQHAALLGVRLGLVRARLQRVVHEWSFRFAELEASAASAASAARRRPRSLRAFASAYSRTTPRRFFF
mmetsp:Transcript_14130/g.42114  ORF Transcript_14130/g.42114 Transcript_14130/m.42114 type:complete len:258 (+) Transcript_14130:209-982(+)